MTEIRVVKGDITEARVDAIVNAANRQLVPGGGVDGAIHAAGGPQIATEARAIHAQKGDLRIGEAVVTTGGDLAARHVIHVAGPIWGEGTEYEAVQGLGACYHNSLDLAAAHNCESIAFPNISTGVYRFPLGLAAETATTAVRTWVEANPARIDLIEFYCFNDENKKLYDELLS